MYTLENILNKYPDSDKVHMRKLINETLIPLQEKVTAVRTPYFKEEKQRTDAYDEADAMLHRHALHMHNIAMQGCFQKTKTIADGYIAYANKFISGDFGITKVEQRKNAIIGDSINLVQLLGYSNGAQISKGLNAVKSDLVSYKPYTNINKEIAIQILDAIRPINKKANAITL